ncbi:ribosomal maturation YjgA family protein [Micromonospora sp. NPDC003197]
MSITPRWVRLLMLAAAAFFLAVALAIRALTSGTLESDGPLAQHSGTALYASMVYAGVLFLWPRMSPLPAGAIAIGFCWLVEFSQLTGIPAALSERSLLARLVLGVQFDLTDILWYPVGVVPLVVLDRLLLSRTPIKVTAEQG